MWYTGQNQLTITIRRHIHSQDLRSVCLGKAALVWKGCEREDVEMTLHCYWLVTRMAPEYCIYTMMHRLNDLTSDITLTKQGWKANTAISCTY